MFLLLSTLPQHCKYLENTDEQVLKKDQRDNRIVQYECIKLFLTLATNFGENCQVRVTETLKYTQPINQCQVKQISFQAEDYNIQSYFLMWFMSCNLPFNSRKFYLSNPLTICFEKNRYFFYLFFL